MFRCLNDFMFLLLALGNPDKQYTHTRHNAGYAAADFIAHTYLFSPFRAQDKFNAALAEGQINGAKTLLAKPLTYMNNSGTAALKLRNYFNLTSDSIIVIHDELDLPFGAIRVRADGSSAGHNGVQSIIEQLNTDAFCRIRIGIHNQKAAVLPADKFVLSKFSFLERHKLNKYILPQVLDELEKIIK